MTREAMIEALENKWPKELADIGRLILKLQTRKR
jgi:hypothetical protein